MGYVPGQAAKHSMKVQMIDLLQGFGLQEWSSVAIAESNYPPFERLFPAPVISWRQARKATNRCLSRKITLDQLWLQVWNVDQGRVREPHAGDIRRVARRTSCK